MNERIKELKLQAMRFAQEKCGGRPTDMHGNLRSDIWTEKFAELIVRECVEQIINRERSDGEWYQDDIFKHFGVEE